MKLFTFLSEEHASSPFEMAGRSRNILNLGLITRSFVLFAYCSWKHSLAIDTVFFNFFQKKKVAKNVLYGFFDIIQAVRSDPQLVFYCLVHLDGILEDDRERVEHYTALNDDFKTPLPVINILNQFLH